MGVSKRRIPESMLSESRCTSPRGDLPLYLHQDRGSFPEGMSSALTHASKERDEGQNIKK